MSWVINILDGKFLEVTKCQGWYLPGGKRLGWVNDCLDTTEYLQQKNLTRSIIKLDFLSPNSLATNLTISALASPSTGGAAI